MELAEVVEWEEEEGTEVGVRLVVQLTTLTKAWMTFWASAQVKFKDLKASSMTRKCVS